MLNIQAIIKQGYRVGSGQALECHDQRFNEDGGTIRLQIPEFRKRGLDFDAYFGGPADVAYVVGTLGCNIAPFAMTIINPEYCFREVRWTDKWDGQIPNFRESFFLSAAKIEFEGVVYKALLYIPDPFTKPGHFHPPQRQLRSLRRQFQTSNTEMLWSSTTTHLRSLCITLRRRQMSNGQSP